MKIKIIIQGNLSMDYLTDKEFLPVKVNALHFKENFGKDRDSGAP